jgi:hypothetical protein
MKNCLIFLGLLISNGLVFATSQTGFNQDKPPRLYVKSYIESAGGNINILEDGSSPLGYTERQNKRIDTFSENIKYQDGLTGSANFQGNENYDYSDASANETEQFQMLCDKTISVSSGAGINYSAVPTTQITRDSDSVSGSMWDIYGNSSQSTGNDVYGSTNNGYGMPGVRSEHCDVGAPIRDHSGSPSYYSFAGEAPPIWQETYKRKAQTTMKLQTGGKAASKLRNLFALSASATQINPVHVNDGYGPYFSYFGYTYTVNGNSYYDYAFTYTFYSPFDNPTPSFTPIPAQSIAIGSYGNQIPQITTNIWGMSFTNGVLYKILPDNADVDVTPFVAGVDYYTFSLTQNKVQTKADWQRVVRDEIYADTGDTADMNTYNPANGFMNNRANLQAVYAFYQKLFTENPNLYWAGLGKLAGAPVYAGLSDAQWAVWAAAALGDATNTWTSFQNTLVQMNTLILQDLAWQSEAYYKCGLNALETAYGFDTNVVDINTWRSIDQGVQQNNPGAVQAGNLLLAHREQLQVLQPDYNTLNGMGAIITNFMKILAQNPVPTGTNFLTIAPGGNLCAFPDRWNWITNNAGGIWPSWVAASPTTQSGWVNIPLTTRAANYAILPIQ